MTIRINRNKLFKNKCLLKIDKSIIPNHINSFTANKLLNKNPNTSSLIYSSQDPYFNGLGKFIRNPNCWLNGVTNISCFSPAQLSGANWWQRAGTLITRKHVLFAAHFQTSVIPGGTPLVFVDDNNNVIRRNIIQYGLDRDSGGIYGTDISIALLDSEVPSNIKIAKVLPTNFKNYINVNIINSIYDQYAPPDTNTFTNIPFLYAVGLNQNEKAILKLWTSCNLWSAGSGGFSNLLWYLSASTTNIDPNGSYALMNPQPQQFAAWSDNIVIGDSGSPLFIIIDNELVVLTTWLTPTSGPFITNRYNQVNNIIESLSPGQGYSLTPIDLSAIYSKYA